MVPQAATHVARLARESAKTESASSGPRPLGPRPLELGGSLPSLIHCSAAPRRSVRPRQGGDDAPPRERAPALMLDGDSKGGAGRYRDLGSAVLGLTSLPLGYLLYTLNLKRR